MEEADPIRVLVCGDRNWTDATVIRETLARVVAQARGPVTVVHGMARGADSLGAAAAAGLGLNVEGYPANWNKYGRAAGPIRNKKMLDSGLDRVLAFHHDLDQSKGTANMVKIATKAGVPVEVIE